MDWACDRVYTVSRMRKTVKCNSRSSDSITKTCYVITIVSLFQINNFIIRDSIFEERQKYTGSVLGRFIPSLCTILCNMEWVNGMMMNCNSLVFAIYWPDKKPILFHEQTTDEYFSNSFLPWANWHILPYLHFPLDMKLRHSCVL